MCMTRWAQNFGEEILFQQWENVWTNRYKSHCKSSIKRELAQNMSLWLHCCWVWTEYFTPLTESMSLFLQCFVGMCSPEGYHPCLKNMYLMGNKQIKTNFSPCLYILLPQFTRKMKLAMTRFLQTRYFKSCFVCSAGFSLSWESYILAFVSEFRGVLSSFVFVTLMTFSRVAIEPLLVVHTHNLLPCLDYVWPRIIMGQPFSYISSLCVAFSHVQSAAIIFWRH